MFIALTLLCFMGIGACLCFCLCTKHKGRYSEQSTTYYSPIIGNGNRVEVDVDKSLLLNRPIHSKVGVAHYLLLDTETFDAIDRSGNEPSPISQAVALSWLLLDENKRLISEQSYIIRRQGKMTSDATAIHHISNRRMHRGVAPEIAYHHLAQDLSKVTTLVAYHLDFHLSVVECDSTHLGINISRPAELICIMKLGQAIGFKHNAQGIGLLPRLDELFAYLYFRQQEVRVAYRDKSLRDLRLLYACFVRLFT